MNGNTLRRYDDSLGVQPLGNLWTLMKDGKRLICALSTHPMGHELRVSAGSEFFRSDVCRHESDVFKTAEAWKDEAVATGWAD